MGKYFGTDGFRGEAGVTLTADHAYKVGRFLGWYYGMLRQRNGETTAPRIVIGKDTRRSSYMFEYSLVAGLTASGADAAILAYCRESANFWSSALSSTTTKTHGWRFMAEGAAIAARSSSSTVSAPTGQSR